MEGTCAFCGNWAELTREDALPSWLMKYLWPPGKRIQMAKSWGKAKDVTANWKYGYDFRLKTMTLCEECNTKWLGPFEERSKAKLTAWISGLKGQVTPSERSLLAFWAIKTAMTVDLAHPSGQGDIPSSQLHELHANRDRPPEGVHVWAALRRKGLRGIGHQSRPFVFEHLDRSEVAPRPKVHAGYQVIFVIGHMELHVLGLGSSGVDPLEILPSEVAPLVGGRSAFYRLWPLPEIPILSE